MHKIIIGRTGTQPFSITAPGVSSQHASLTISDDGVWTLEDLDSQNGTFVMNDKHVFERIETKIITKDSVIRLGDETINGLTFIALQLTKENQDDYSYEFARIKRNWKKLKEENAQTDLKIDRLSYIVPLVSVVGMLFSMTSVFEAIFGAEQMMAVRIVMLVPSLISPIVNKYAKRMRRQLNEKFAITLKCPKCGRILSEQEIIKEQCLMCKAHG